MYYFYNMIPRSTFVNYFINTHKLMQRLLSLLGYHLLNTFSLLKRRHGLFVLIFFVIDVMSRAYDSSHRPCHVMSHLVHPILPP